MCHVHVCVYIYKHIYIFFSSEISQRWGIHSLTTVNIDWMRCFVLWDANAVLWGVLGLWAGIFLHRNSHVEMWLVDGSVSRHHMTIVIGRIRAPSPRGSAKMTRTCNKNRPHSERSRPSLLSDWLMRIPPRHMSNHRRVCGFDVTRMSGRRVGFRRPTFQEVIIGINGQC